MLDLGTKPLDVVVEHRTRKYVRSEIAVSALGSTKWNGDVQSERHQYDYRAIEASILAKAGILTQAGTEGWVHATCGWLNGEF